MIHTVLQIIMFFFKVRHISNPNTVKWNGIEILLSKPETVININVGEHRQKEQPGKLVDNVTYNTQSPENLKLEARQIRPSG